MTEVASSNDIVSKMVEAKVVHEDYEVKSREAFADMVMEDVIEEDEITEDPELLDLSGQGLEKLSRAPPEWQLNATTLVLDNNNLQRLDNIHTFQCIEKLSVQHNRLLRMFQVSKLSHLKILNLAHNCIVTMEGLKELKLLTWLSLASNSIKGIENLNQNVHLEHLDLSDNMIPCITDLSYLRNLRTLLLHKNKITSLKGCNKFLPSSLTTLTLNDNLITDLTDVGNLTELQGLEQLTLTNNTAIEQPEDIRNQYDYRPYVINWCLGLRVLDGIHVGAKESLKAEWMYSQGKGRHFTAGQQAELLEYLVQTCPLHPDKDWQEDPKLNLILSKVQEHQSSLRLETGMSPRASIGSSNTLPRSQSVESTPRTTIRRHSQSGSNGGTPIQSRRLYGTKSRTSPSPVRRSLTPGGRRGTPDRPGSGYRVDLPKSLYGADAISVMSMSMDPGQLSSRLTPASKMSESCDANMLAMTRSLHTMESYESQRANEAWMSDEGTTTFNNNRSKNNVKRSINEDLTLQDLSDGEMSQSKLYGRGNIHHSKLNPVPESLNSPDVSPNLGPNSTPRRDDAILLYRRNDLMTNSMMPQPTVQSHLHEKEQKVMSKSMFVPETKQNMAKISSGPSARKTGIPNKQVTKLKSRYNQHQASEADEESSFSESEPDHGRQSRSLKRNGSPSGQGRKKSSPKPTGSQDIAHGASGKQSKISRSQSARLSNSSGTSSKYAPEKYSSSPLKRPSTTTASGSQRPVSAPTSKGSASIQNSKSNTLSHQRSSGVRKNLSGTQGSKTLPAKTLNTDSKATTIQKHWRGHQVRNNDEKVQELKEEIRSLRTEEHIKFLTKELQTAKQALDQERKLRSLQMDAIKLLWKEVQMMDAAKGGGVSSLGENKTKPSGIYGSKISSRSSEHSIAKLMETLEATTVRLEGGKAIKDDEDEVDDECKDQSSSETQKDLVMVQKLNETCNSLQTQVEQLQSSLSGMMKFMSSISANMEVFQARTRHSSSTSTQDTASFQFYAGPGSLPPSMFTSMVDPTNGQQSDSGMFASLDPSIGLVIPTKKSTDAPKAESFCLFENPQEQSNDPKESTKSSPPRPSTLPGLNEAVSKSKTVPGLAQLAEKVVKESPAAPKEVKSFAKTLVKDILIESISKIDLPEKDKTGEQTSDQRIKKEKADEPRKASQEKKPFASPPNEEVSYSSFAEDSLDENSGKSQG